VTLNVSGHVVLINAQAVAHPELSEAALASHVVSEILAQPMQSDSFGSPCVPCGLVDVELLHEPIELG
jgi:hypothetical protein